MKNLRQKKMKFFGKELSVFFVVMIAVMGVGSAALVAYISNTVTGDVDVASPFEFLVSNNGADWDTSVGLGNLYGGMSTTLYTKITNKADVRIEADDGVEITITDSENNAVDCDEFTIKAYETSTNTLIGEYDSSTQNGLFCTDNGENVTISTNAVNLDAGASQEIYFEITTAVNMQPSEDYSFSGEVVYK